MCQVEHVDLLFFPQLLGLLGCHGLNANIPARIVALLDGLVQVLCRLVRRIVRRVLLGDEPSALLGLEVELHINPLALATRS